MSRLNDKIESFLDERVIHGTVVARVYDEWGVGPESMDFLGVSSADYMIRQERDRRLGDGGGTS